MFPKVYLYYILTPGEINCFVLDTCNRFNCPLLAHHGVISEHIAPDIASWLYCTRHCATHCATHYATNCATHCATNCATHCATHCAPHCAPHCATHCATRCLSRHRARLTHQSTLAVDPASWTTASRLGSCTQLHPQTTRCVHLLHTIGHLLHVWDCRCIVCCILLCMR